MLNKYLSIGREKVREIGRGRRREGVRDGERLNQDLFAPPFPVIRDTHMISQLFQSIGPKDCLELGGPFTGNMEGMCIH